LLDGQTVHGASNVGLVLADDDGQTIAA